MLPRNWRIKATTGHRFVKQITPISRYANVVLEVFQRSGRDQVLACTITGKVQPGGLLALTITNGKGEEILTYGSLRTR